MTLFNDSDLQILEYADAEDLGVLIDHLTDKGEGRLSMSSEACRKLTAAKAEGTISLEARILILEELQRFGGNSLANLFRGGSGVAYREIVSDVADHVKAPYNARQECQEIEIAILLKVLEQSLDKMTDAQRKALLEELRPNYTVGAGALTTAMLISAIKLSGFSAYKLSAVVANAVMKALLGRGLSFGATAGMMRGISAFAGPIGWAVTAIWTAFDLASPAYRVTVPCVVHIAYMRQKSLSRSCPRCGHLASIEAKFCTECGSCLGDAKRLFHTD